MKLEDRLRRALGREGVGPGRLLLRRAGIAFYRHGPVRAALRPFLRVRTPERWFFIVGCYNSGTTILRDLLRSHPRIAGLPKEGVRFTSELTRPEDLGWDRMWCRVPDHVRLAPAEEPEKARRVMRDWSPWWARDASIFLEKSIANTARMEWLDLNFRPATFVGMIRNGYCVAEGIRRRARPRGAAVEALGGRTTYSIEMAAEQWVASLRAQRDGASRVEDYVEIRYEELVADPVAVLDSLWSALGLDPPPTSLRDGVLEIAGRRFTIRDGNSKSFANLTAEDVAAANESLAPALRSEAYNIL